MFKYFLIIIAFFASFSLFAQPKLVIEGGNTYNWGDVTPEQSPLKASVKLYNKGDQLLVIEKVKPGCGCTTAPLDKDKIEPGDFATLDISLRLGTASGSMTKGITITTNEPEQKNQRLLLKANVKTPYKMFPSMLSFGSLTIGQKSSAKVVITNNTDKPIKVSEVVKEPANMTLNVEKGTVISPNSEFTLQAEYTPTMVGNFRSSVTLKTSHPEVSEINIKGWGRIRKADTGSN